MSDALSDATLPDCHRYGPEASCASAAATRISYADCWAARPVPLSFQLKSGVLSPMPSGWARRFVLSSLGLNAGAAAAVEVHKAADATAARATPRRTPLDRRGRCFTTIFSPPE